jgi:hypothetical protein
MLHWPVCPKQVADPKRTLEETWRCLELLLESGRCRSIGVSNFQVSRHKVDLSNLYIFRQHSFLINFCPRTHGQNFSSNCLRTKYVGNIGHLSTKLYDFFLSLKPSHLPIHINLTSIKFCLSVKAETRYSQNPGRINHKIILIKYKIFVKSAGAGSAGHHGQL